MADQSATVEIQAKASGLAAQLREAAAKFESFADGVTKKLNKKAKKGKGTYDVMGKMLGTAGGNLLSAGVGKATDYIEDAAESAFSYQEKLTRLQINADATSDTMNTMASAIAGASDKTGKSKNEIVDAAAAYVALTGDVDTAVKSIDTWTTVAQATNATVDDVAHAAASLHTNLGVASKDMMSVLGGLASQGKKGAIEIKDLAGQVSNIAPMWSAFGGDDPAKKALKLGAALQVAKRAFGGDAGETVTGLQGMLAAFEKNAPRFAEHGVNVFQKNGKGMRDVYDIIQQIQKSDLMQHPDKMIHTFGRIEGMRGGEELVKSIADMKDFANVTDGAAMIARDLDTFMNSAAGRTEKAMNHLKNTIAETFTPERIQEFAGALERVVVGLEDAWHYFNGPTKEEHKALSTLGLVNMQNDRGEGAAIAHANQLLNMSPEEIKKLQGAAGGNVGSIMNMSSDEKGILKELIDSGGIAQLQAGAKEYLASVSNRVGRVSHSTNAYQATTEQALYDNPALNRGLDSKQLAAALAKAIADGFAAVSIQMDGSKVGKATKDAHSHRHDVKK